MPAATNDATATLLAIDWGTSSLRGALLAADGRVLHERSFARGILTVPAGAFESVLNECFGDWRTDGLPCLVSGMAGSRQGWIEAPYCPCPAGFSELALGLVRPGAAGVALVPGLSCEQQGMPDVMRGEEVQIFGAIDLTGCADGRFVLPGTHSKWAEVRGGRVLGFRTFMTGEFYALLSQHSILARTLDAQAAFDQAFFVQGVERAGAAGGLLHQAFGARALALFGRLDPGQTASYLSGLLIGTELQGAAPAPGAPLVLIGSDALTTRYALALQVQGLASTSLGASATWAGLHALSAHL